MEATSKPNQGASGTKEYTLLGVDLQRNKRGQLTMPRGLYHFSTFAKIVDGHYALFQGFHCAGNYFFDIEDIGKEDVVNIRLKQRFLELCYERHGLFGNEKEAEMRGLDSL